MVIGNSKDLVRNVFAGEEVDRVPCYAWLADAELEAQIGDVIGIRIWFDKFSHFLEEGGLFARTDPNFRKWAENVDPNDLEIPTEEELIQEIDREIRSVPQNILENKFTQMEIMGPSEEVEYACGAGQRVSAATELDQVHHTFDFAILTRLNPQVADEIHRRFFEVTKLAVEIASDRDEVDSMRLGDDFCSYKGSNYDPYFTETIVERQIKIGKLIKRSGRPSFIHADGDLREYLPKLTEAFTAFHPLDVRPKSTVKDTLLWIKDLGTIRREFKEMGFSTGIPIDLVCNFKVPIPTLEELVKAFLQKIGRKRVLLTTTHRPYPLITFESIKGRLEACFKQGMD